MGDGSEIQSSAERGCGHRGRALRPCTPIPPASTRWIRVPMRSQQSRSDRQPLLADAQFLNDGLVAFGIGLSEVVEQAATLAHHHEKTAPGGMVLLVGLEMLR